MYDDIVKYIPYGRETPLVEMIWRSRLDVLTELCEI